jgi:DNA-binding Lrp family transcriptional regulator
MLQRIIEYLGTNETGTSKEIARKLDISQETLLGMLEELERLGYVRRNTPDCDEECAGCPYSCPDPEEIVTIWTLIKK